jgi:hypothetical protein
MAGQEAHGEASERFYWQLLHNNTQIPSRAPDSPILTALLLEDFRDEDQDSAEFQLAPNSLPFQRTLPILAFQA